MSIITNMKHMKNKNDIILITALLLAGAVLMFVNSPSRQPGEVVKVSYGREDAGVYALSLDREIVIENAGGRNVVLISNGTVVMKEANCPGGDCVARGAIDRAGQSVACLPNKILITIEGAGEGGIDSLAY